MKRGGESVEKAHSQCVHVHTRSPTLKPIAYILYNTMFQIGDKAVCVCCELERFLLDSPCCDITQILSNSHVLSSASDTT